MSASVNRLTSEEDEVPVKQWLVLWVVFLMVVATAMSVAYSVHVSRKLTNELQELYVERDALQVEWGQLLLEHSTWGSYGRVEKLAQKELKMLLPKPSDIVRVKQ